MTNWIGFGVSRRFDSHATDDLTTAGADRVQCAHSHPSIGDRRANSDARSRRRRISFYLHSVPGAYSPDVLITRRLNEPREILKRRGECALGLRRPRLLPRLAGQAKSTSLVFSDDQD